MVRRHNQEANWPEEKALQSVRDTQYCQEAHLPFSSSNLNLGRRITSLYSERIRASKESVSSPDETMRTISPQTPNGDKRPATITLVSSTMFIVSAFTNSFYLGVNLIHRNLVGSTLYGTALKRDNRFNCAGLTKCRERFLKVFFGYCRKDGYGRPLLVTTISLSREALSISALICLLNP